MPNGARYTKKNLPWIDASTVAHDVAGFSLENVWEILMALRDRGAKLRLIFVTPKGVVTDSSGVKLLSVKDDKRTASERKASTAPLDPEDMSDADLWDWLNNDALKGAGYKPLFIMEME